MPSSTSIPNTKINQKVDNTLIVTPTKGAKINIPKNETGRPKATQKASLEFKKSERNINTKIIPWKIFSINSLFLPLSVSEASVKTSSLEFSF